MISKWPPIFAEKMVPFRDGICTRAINKWPKYHSCMKKCVKTAGQKHLKSRGWYIYSPWYPCRSFRKANIIFIRNSMADMNSFSNGQAPLLDPSGENMATVNPELYLQIERERSMARATSIFLGGNPSNAIPAKSDPSPVFHPFEKLPYE
jgi:hypothetical protein